MYNIQSAQYRVKKSMEKLLGRIHDLDIQKQSMIDESHLIESGQKVAVLGSIHDRYTPKQVRAKAKYYHTAKLRELHLELSFYETIYEALSKGG
jgi:hypothetical protein